MILRQILSRRSNLSQNYAQPIIYEWEDEISRELNIPVINYSPRYKLLNRLKLHVPFMGPNTDTFRYVINGRDNDEPMNSNHIIPCIIDFFEKGDRLQLFYKRHSNNKIILVSSPFDYQYLKDRNCPIEVGLFAYSISDKFAISEKANEKKYDIVLTGRQDPLLYSFFKEYIIRHPDVTYVKRGKELDNDFNKTKEYYINGRECIGALETREDFMMLQSQGRSTLYGVQGYEEGDTKGFYHMTPHFLEIIACACHVIAHYPSGKDGIDAQYYEFDRFSPSVETYEAFEAAMDTALSTDVDREEYALYLKKHYTSCRVLELQKMLDTL